MMRNEYRRAYIMLRAVMPGYGGHVRLERRTLTGSMYFIITAPQGVGELAAALVGRQNGEYFAAPIGPLSRDRRGQLALAWQFDPRSIEGRPLEAYAWVTVVATGGPCALALTGNVEGSRPADARALGEAACALFAPTWEAPAADLPEAETGEGPSGGGLAGMESGEGPVGGGLPSGGGLAVSEGAAGPSGSGQAMPSGGGMAVSEVEAVPSGGGLAVSSGGDPAGPEVADAGETCGDVRVYTMTRARLRRAAGHGRAAATRPAGQDRAGSAIQPAAEPAQGANEPTRPAGQDRAGSAIQPAAEPAQGANEPTRPAAEPAQGANEPTRPAAEPAQGANEPTRPAAEPAHGANELTRPAAEPTQGGEGVDPATTGPESATTDPAPVTAAKRLGLDITVPWPGVAEGLRRLFATQPPASDAPDDGFTYVAAPMPAGSGYPDSLAGLRAEGRRVAAVRYALPGRPAPEPPAGLEAATWLPGEGGSGFWVTEEGEF